MPLEKLNDLLQEYFVAVAAYHEAKPEDLRQGELRIAVENSFDALANQDQASPDSYLAV